MTSGSVEFRNNYFDWLCGLINGKENHSLLLYKLFKKEFYWSVVFDDDRAADAKDLRKTYLDMLCSDDLTGMEYVSVLEVIISMAISCEDNLMNDRKLGDRTGEWFWMMIRNLGLLPFSDDKWSERAENEVSIKLDIWLNRCYEFDGKGGLFPLKKCHRDQRKVDLWSQLQEYLQENYDF